MLLLDFFRTVYRPLRLLGRSPKTVQLYEESIRIFGRYLGRLATLDDLTDAQVAAFLQHLLDNGYRPGGANKHRAQLCALWNFAARKRFVNEFPTLRPLPEPEQIPRAWTLHELWRIKISCNYVSGNYEGIPANLWWIALHHVLWATGERISATLSARWCDLYEGSICFRAETRKGGVRAKVCHLPEDALEAVERIRLPERELIFPWPKHPTYIWAVYRKILKRAELDHDSRSLFHKMRRSHATHLQIHGGNPQTSLGHSSPAVTAKYVDVAKLPRQDHLLPHFGAG